MQVLIVEDSHDVAEVIAFTVGQAWPGCQAVVAGSGNEALVRMEQDAPDLVVLDLALPGLDGFEVCRRIRERSDVPILILSVRGDVIDKVRALDLGADDYLTKPFDLLELLARLRGVGAPRNHARQGYLEQVVSFGDLSIDFSTQEVRLRDTVVPLTSMEYRLLEVLANHAGTTLPHRLLLEQVWGPAYAADTKYLKVFVRRLRRKLADDAQRPRYIQTQWGVGYRFAVAGSRATDGWLHDARATAPVSA